MGYCKGNTLRVLVLAWYRVSLGFLICKGVNTYLPGYEDHIREHRKSQAPRTVPGTVNVDSLSVSLPAELWESNS